MCEELSSKYESSMPDADDGSLLDDWGCCSQEVPQAPQSSMVHSLSYAPARYEEKATTDTTRSHERYGNIVVHNTRDRYPRRGRTWESWLRFHAAGWPVTLIGPHPTDINETIVNYTKIAATCYFDRNLTRFTVFPYKLRDSDVIMVDVDSLQVVCAATDFISVLEGAEAHLDVSELERAVLIHYVAEDLSRRRICFVMDNEHTKARFLQALTGLWLEKRVDKSSLVGRQRIHLSV